MNPVIIFINLYKGSVIVVKQQSKVDILISRAKTITDADPTAKSLNTLGSVLFIVNMVVAVFSLIGGIAYFAVSMVEHISVDQTTVIILICCVGGGLLLFLIGYVLKLIIKGFAYMVQYTSEAAIASRLQAEAVIYELKRKEIEAQYVQQTAETSVSQDLGV